MSKPSVTKNVAPNLYFLSSGRVTVKWDLLASSNVSTTSLSGIGSSAIAVDPTTIHRMHSDNLMPWSCVWSVQSYNGSLGVGLRPLGNSSRELRSGSPSQGCCNRHCADCRPQHDEAKANPACARRGWL